MDITSRPRRKALRLPDFDYSEARAYFVTICVKGRECLFGEIADGEMHLNKYGNIVADCWLNLPEHYANLELDSFVVMPNHIHGIITIVVGAGLKPAPTKPLAEIVRGLKTFSSQAINTLRGSQGRPVWQRNYYEHIIRNEKSLDRIREYIDTNPINWDLDRENPQAKGKDDFDLWLAAFPRPKVKIGKNTPGIPTGGGTPGRV